MDASEGRMQRRRGMEPSQRRVRHIHCILGRNLTYSPVENHRSLSSILMPNNIQGGRPGTPSSNAERFSGASSPTRSYFRSPWKYPQGDYKFTKGPGSETGSISVASERGSTTRETGRRQSNAGMLPPPFLSPASANGLGSMTSTFSPIAHRKSDTKGMITSQDGNNIEQWRRPPTGLVSLPTSPAPKVTMGSISMPTTPPPSREKPAMTDGGVNPQGVNKARLSIPDQARMMSPGMVPDKSRTPPEIEDPIPSKPPCILDTFLSLYEVESGNLLYTSETVCGSNNPKFDSFEESHFVDRTKRRSDSIVVRIWAKGGDSTADFTPFLEWTVELACLRYIGQELKDIPCSLPCNTLVFALGDGFYTAPDEDDNNTPQIYLSTTNNFASNNSLDYFPLDNTFIGAKKRSYTYESVMRLNSLHECIADTQKSRDEIKQNIETSLANDSAPLLLRKRKGEFTERLYHLQRQVGSELNLLDQLKEKAAKLKQELEDRRKNREESKERRQTQEMYLEENQENLEKNKSSLFAIMKEHTWKRAELIQTLLSIFPIAESDVDSKLMTICGVPLPNSIFIGHDEDLVATSLGLTCQLVAMLAHYLSVPLRYHLTAMGSRSFVYDPVSMLIGPKVFPLFGKGQDRYRFEYGVFLLNKDIEQLMNSQGVQFMDLRETLPNIKYLVESLLTTSPMQSMAYRSKFLGKQRKSTNYPWQAPAVVVGSGTGSASGSPDLSSGSKPDLGETTGRSLPASPKKSSGRLMSLIAGRSAVSSGGSSPRGTSPASVARPYNVLSGLNALMLTASGVAGSGLGVLGQVTGVSTVGENSPHGSDRTLQPRRSLSGKKRGKGNGTNGQGERGGKDEDEEEHEEEEVDPFEDDDDRAEEHVYSLLRTPSSRDLSVGLSSGGVFGNGESDFGNALITPMNPSTPLSATVSLQNNMNNTNDNNNSGGLDQRIVWQLNESTLDLQLPPPGFRVQHPRSPLNPRRNGPNQESFDSSLVSSEAGSEVEEDEQEEEEDDEEGGMDDENGDSDSGDLEQVDGHGGWDRHQHQPPPVMASEERFVVSSLKNKCGPNEKLSNNSNKKEVGLKI